MSLTGSTSFGFAQNTIHDFQNTVLNSYWHCLRQMPQKNRYENEQIKLEAVICLRKRWPQSVVGSRMTSCCQQLVKRWSHSNETVFIAI